MNRGTYEEEISKARFDLFSQAMYTLSKMSDYELIDVANQYFDLAHYPDDHIYIKSDFDTLFEGQSPSEIAKQMKNIPADSEYFWYDGYGKLNGTSRVEGLSIDIDSIATYVSDNEESFGNSTLEDLVSEYRDKISDIESDYER